MREKRKGRTPEKMRRNYTYPLRKTEKSETERELEIERDREKGRGREG